MSYVAYSETNRRSGSKRRVGRPGGTSAEAQPGQAYPLIGISKRVVDVRRRIVGVCNVRCGCAVTQINVAVPAFEEYDYLITCGLCFSRLSTCSRRRALVERRIQCRDSRHICNLRFAVKLCEQTREDDVEHGV